MLWREGCCAAVCRFCDGHAAGGTVGSGTAPQTVRSQARVPMVSLELYIDIILPAAQ